jgi:hypothetical protein
VEFRLTILLHVPHLREMAESSWAITTGRPDWIEFQSRLLGPWLIRGFGTIFQVDPLQAWLDVSALLVLGKNLLCLFLLLRLTGRAAVAGAGTLAFSFLSLAFLDSHSIYPWDFLDPAVFLLFLFGVLGRKGNGYFLALFLIALFNRESALFIPLWMMLDSFPLRRGRTGEQTLPSWNKGRFLLGLALLAGGAGLLLFLRQRLLVEELGPALLPAFSASRPFFLLGNLYGIWEAFTYFLGHPWAPEGISKLFDSVGFLFLLGGVAAIVAGWRRWDDLMIKQTLLLLAMAGSIFLFGLVLEARVMAMLTPFFVVLPLVAAGLATAGGKAGRSD